MADSKITEIKGLITTADGQVREFSITEDGAWQQWGNTNEVLGNTSAALQVMANALMEDDRLVSLADPEEEECRECEAPLDDGEGWDGLCGSCADREARDEEAEDEMSPDRVHAEDEADEL